MRHKGIRICLLVGVFALLGVVGYKAARSIWLIKQFRENPVEILDNAPEAALQLKTFHHTNIENGKRAWEVLGEEARYLKGKKEAVVKKPRLVFYHRDGETTKATGNTGRLFFKDKELDRMQLLGDIEINHQGLTLRTDEIVYVRSANQIVSPGKITLKGKGIELEGVGAEFAIQDEKFRLLQKVKTKLQPGRLEKMRIKLDGN